MRRLVLLLLLLPAPALGRQVVKSVAPRAEAGSLPPGETVCAAEVTVSRGGRPTTVDVSACVPEVQAPTVAAVRQWRFVRGEAETFTVRVRYRGEGAARSGGDGGPPLLYVPRLPADGGDSPEAERLRALTAAESGWYAEDPTTPGLLVTRHDAPLPALQLARLEDPLVAMRDLSTGRAVGVAPASPLFTHVGSGARAAPCGVGESWYGVLGDAGPLGDARVRAAIVLALEPAKVFDGLVDAALWEPLRGPFVPSGPHGALALPAPTEGWRDLMRATGAEKRLWWLLDGEAVRLRVAVPEEAELEVPGFASRVGAVLRAAGFDATVWGYHGDWATLDRSAFDLVITRKAADDALSLGGPFAATWSESVSASPDALLARLPSEASHVFLAQVHTPSAWRADAPTRLVEAVCGTWGVDAGGPSD